MSKLKNLKEVQIIDWVLDAPELAAKKVSWGDGEWQKEIDRLFWRDQHSGYYCLILRNPAIGTLCGYVALGPSHPYFTLKKTPREGIYFDNLVVHGSVTYAGFATVSSENDITTIPYLEINNQPVFWVGFDCAHGGDLLPGGLVLLQTRATYRSLDYVINECESLAEQLHQRER